jgi:hypothetical protein
MKADWIKILEQYRWSSYQNYNDLLKQSECLQRDVLKEYINLPEPYLKWLKDQNDFNDVAHLMLD